jgi:hypothetical protein
VQPTPLCGDKMIAILKTEFGPKRVSIYQAARLTFTVGRQLINASLRSNDAVHPLHTSHGPSRG